MAEVTGFDRATSAAREYAAAWGDAVAAIEQGSGDRSTRLEAAALHVHRAGRQIEALCAGLAEVHAEVAAVAALADGATVEGYAGDDLLRVVRAAIAFRKAAPRHTWPHQPWGEMAELCAAVDRKPGPEAGIRAAPFAMCDKWHILAGQGWGAAACNVGLPGHRIDETQIMLARDVSASRRCSTPACRRQYARADRGES